MNQTPIQIITDSTCDIPQNLVDEYHIQIVPHYVIWDNEQYKDRINLTPEAFYDRLSHDPSRPTSAQATEEDFFNAYKTAIQGGAKELIVVTVSSAMSGAYQMAIKAARHCKIPVHVVDAKGPTMSVGWQVLAAARACSTITDANLILEKVSSVRNHLVQIVGMNTLEYLQKGGRIGGAVKWIGSVLSVKPVVKINHQSGLVEPVGMARTYQNMINLMYQKFFGQITNMSGALHIAILHGNAQEQAEALAVRIQTEFHPVECLINITGPVLGINTGPRALALCGYTE